MSASASPTMRRAGRPPRRLARSLALILVSAGLLGGLASAPAAADHDWPTLSFRFGRGPAVQRGGHRAAHHAKLEFRRGYDYGALQGLERGYRDATNGGVFCDNALHCPSGASAYYHRGFDQSYAQAYRAGFDFGRRACDRHGFDAGRRGPDRPGRRH